MRDALIVHLFRDERIAKFAKPQLHEGSENMWVVDAIQGVVPTVDT